MQYLIYLDANNDIRAQMFVNPDDYAAFAAKLDPSAILYVNKEVQEQNIPDIHREVFPVFLKTMQKQWEGRRVMVAPPAPPMLPVEAPVATPKPKRKSRKKAE